jgi:hypothetical protein
VVLSNLFVLSILVEWASGERMDKHGHLCLFIDSVLFLFFKPKNLTQCDGVKTRAKRLLQFEITGVKS